MAATEPSMNSLEANESAEREAKTIFNILSKLKDSETSQQIIIQPDIQQEADEDILILRKDPRTKQGIINKTAYLKLHRNLSPNRNNIIEEIKAKYEKIDEHSLENSQVETVETLKNKYSPSGLGYTTSSTSPTARPRRSRLSKSQIILPSKKEETKAARLSLNVEKNKHKDVNSNELQTADLSSDEEFVTIITRSDSEESILQIQKELSAFTMDKKKRANSFRKIFSVFSNKDKKKKEKNKTENKQNGDNFQNENNSFSRQTPYRHTTGGESKTKPPNPSNLQRSDSDVKVPKEYNEQQLERDYAQMHINQFNQSKQNFENSLIKNSNQTSKVNPTGYTPMDKPIQKNNESANTYMNMPNIRKYIDTSSSASTLESDRSNIYQNDVGKSNQPTDEECEIRAYPSNSFRPNRIADGRRDTPPRLLETKQDVRLVSPRALIPINSERALPNPYQNVNKEPSSPANNSIPRNKPLFQSTPTNQTQQKSFVPYLNDTYGTVFDSVEIRPKSQSKDKSSPDKSSRSPSVEATKLKLPPNREIVPLSPRVKSPIPSDTLSTDKIIATELLKPKRSPTPTKKYKEEIPSHQNLEIDIDYPDRVNHNHNLLRNSDHLVSKPPLSVKSIPRTQQENANKQNNRISQASPSASENVVLRPKISPVDNSTRITTDAQVHINSPVNRVPTPNKSLSQQNLSLTPIRPTNINLRPSTPSGSQITESPKTTPQKEDMRKSVEAYYWKEIKKLKHQENYELYLLQMQYGHMPQYGYTEEPISVRRSRSMSPLASRNGRRSSSLPRETRPPANIIMDNYFPNAIPENTAVTNQVQPRSMQQLQFQQQQQYFQRNASERSTIDASNMRKYDHNTNSLYRPIFKRGSLSSPPKQLVEDPLKRKVSFSGAQDQNPQAWPTKNGFTQSPPQRRIDKIQNQEDDEVFWPATPKMANEVRFRYFDPNARPDLRNEEMYYNTRQNLVGPNVSNDPTYVLRANQNSLYLHRRQPIENPYGQRVQHLPRQQEDVLYGQPVDAVRNSLLRRHGSIQIQEELYPQNQHRMSYQNSSMQRPSVPSTPVPIKQDVHFMPRRPPSQQGVPILRREIIVNDEIFGQFGGYSGVNNNVRVVPPQNVYASRQSIADQNSRTRDEFNNRTPQKQVSVSNKVCDIYGQIHDTDPQRVEQSGVLMGRLQQNPGSPPVVRSSHSQLPGTDNFMRNSRLTASANDMYRKLQIMPPQRYPNNETLYGRIEQTQLQNGSGAPNRPLPPVPQKKPGTRGMFKNNTISDTESGSDASEVQRILNNNSKSKKRSIFGK